MDKSVIPPHLRDLSPYVPGRLIEDVEAELGLSGIVKLASNENCLGPSPRALAAAQRALDSAHRYGDADSRALKKALAGKFGFDPPTLVAGNGSSEFILLLCHALLGPGLKAVMSRPSFTLYASNARAAGAEAVEAPLTAEYGHDLTSLRRAVDDQTRLVFLDNPLNPTGAWLDAEELQAFHRDLPDHAVLVVDEAYVDFARRPRPDWRTALHEPGRLVVLRTFSKAYGLAGLRAAYALMDPELAGAINKMRQPFNLNAPAQAAALAALEDEDFLKKTLETTWAGLDFFHGRLGGLGLKTYPTEANFLMVELNRPAAEVFQRVLRRGVITRALGSFGLDRHLRVNAGLENENQAFIRALAEVLEAEA